jgi:hypothetical protein
LIGDSDLQYIAGMESDLDRAMKILVDQRAVIDMRDATIAKLDSQVAQFKVQVADLEKALCEQFGAHGVLITQYCNPKLSDTARRQATAAAIGYEKAKLTAPQQHSHTFALYQHMEAARMARRQVVKAIPPAVIDVEPEPAA